MTTLREERILREKMGNKISDCVNRQSFTSNDCDEILTLIQQYTYLKAEKELPDKHKNHTWYKDDLGEAGKMGYDLAVGDMLQPDSEGRVWASVYKEW